jgi:hypothetical protein
MTGSLLAAVLRIGALHDIEVAQRHKPIAWWRERFGEDWVSASTEARRNLDAAIRETVAEVQSES